MRLNQVLEHKWNSLIFELTCQLLMNLYYDKTTLHPFKFKLFAIMNECNEKVWLWVLISYSKYYVMMIFVGFGLN